MANRKAERREPVTRGTGNVFADLEFPDAAERQAKLRLAYALNQVIEDRELSQAEAAKLHRHDRSRAKISSLISISSPSIRRYQGPSAGCFALRRRQRLPPFSMPLPIASRATIIVDGVVR